MHRQRWVLFSALSLFFLLLSLPINSRADTLLQDHTGPMHSYGHGVGWLAATQAPRFGHHAVPAAKFGRQWNGMRDEVGTIAWPRTHVGRSLSRFSDWNWSSSVWNGTNEDDGENDGCDNKPPVSVPEPGTLVLLASGFLGLVLVRRLAAS